MIIEKEEIQSEIIRLDFLFFYYYRLFVNSWGGIC